jgi:hypothetical protein
MLLDGPWSSSSSHFTVVDSHVRIAWLFTRHLSVAVVFSAVRLSAGAAPGGVSRSLTFLEIGDDRLEPLVVQRRSTAGVAMPASVVRYCLS